MPSNLKSPNEDGHYDYIIVGAGSAGCVMAARLTEDPNVRVLLIEAGKWNNSVFVRMPAALSYPLSDAKNLWTYETGPEPYLGNRMISHVRGRLMGGSSAINGLVYVRGNHRDYDEWAKNGLNEWSFEKCLPYFKKMEDFDGGENFYRGESGPIRITTCKAENPIFSAYLKAGQQYGLKLNPDYNGVEQEGVHVYQANIDRGVRASCAHAYLKKASRRPNLTIADQSQVLKILFNGSHASGVLIKRDEKLVKYQSSIEVILSGGTYESPRLLMLSGVGSKEKLSKIGIPVVVNLPGVGENLRDHPCVPIGYKAAYKGVSPVTRLNIFKMGLIGAQWLFLRRGLGTSNFWEVGSFFKSEPGVDYCNIQHEFIPMVGDFTHGSNDIHDGFLYQTCLMRPRSTGRINLVSSDPSVPPSVIHNYLENKEDIRDLREGVRRTLEMIAQPAWDKIRGEALNPEIASFSDSELDSWLRDNVSTQYHPCGTCKMGDDEMSVVDQNGKVHGLTGLRVVDASIIPSLTSGNLNAPTIMVAEKIADSMKKSF